MLTSLNSMFIHQHPYLLKNLLLDWALLIFLQTEPLSKPDQVANASWEWKVFASHHHTANLFTNGMESTLFRLPLSNKELLFFSSGKNVEGA